MWSFIVRNILQRVILLVIVSFMAHSIIHLAPGELSEVDPMNPRMKPEDIAKIRAAFHLMIRCIYNMAIGFVTCLPVN